MQLKAICATLAISFAGPALAGQPTPISTLRLSAQLFAAGQSQQDALLMMTAAKMRKSVVVRPQETSVADDAPSDASPTNWQDMLDAAAQVAGDDETLQGLIEDIRTETTKGVSEGPVFSQARIKPGGTDIYPPLPFSGGAYAEVYVEGKGHSDLNLFVYDAQDRLVCSDTDVSDIAYCGWNPSSTAGYKVEVRNKGPRENDYALVTN